MCGRYTLRTSVEVLAAQFQVSFPSPLSPRYNIAPTQPVLVVRHNPDGAVRDATFMRWGLIPSWAKDSSIGNRTINARAETVAQKPAFRGPLRTRRCLVPADGFYEWTRVGRVKVPHFLQLDGGQPFAFAGLWDRWRSPDGALVERCTLLTTNANAMLRPIHHRMPVILGPEGYARWLDLEITQPDQLRDLLKPYPAEHMTAFPVTTYMNNPRHDDPQCVNPANAAEDG